MQLFKQKLSGICEALDIDFDKKEVICFVGAGGKTTTMFKLARELKALNKNVLVTTTTAIYYPYDNFIDKVVIYEDIPQILNMSKVEGSVIVIGRGISKDNKLQGLDRKIIDEIHNRHIFDYILVEGDGSRRKPIKAPASYEPVIPECTTITVGVIGLDSLYKPIDDKYLHRPDIFCEITNSQRNQFIDEEKVAKLIVADKGLFKDIPKGSKRYLLLNKAETKEKIKLAYRIYQLIKRENYNMDGIILASLLNNEIYR